MLPVYIHVISRQWLTSEILTFQIHEFQKNSNLSLKIFLIQFKSGYEGKGKR
jgi:hypothetical protein